MIEARPFGGSLFLCLLLSATASALKTPALFCQLQAGL